MIFYFALLLISLGILSLLFTALSILMGKNQGVAEAAAPPSAKTHTVQKPSPLKPGRKAPLETILQSYPPAQSINQKRERTWLDEDLPEQKNVTVVEQREPVRTPHAEEEPVLINGVLFLDQGRQIQFQAGKMQDSPLRFFQELKRVGKGTLTLQGSNFRIDTAHATHNYSAPDLEQILFLHRGVALVPSNRSLPVPVFLTDTPDQVKEFIKRHSRLRA